MSCIDDASNRDYRWFVDYSHPLPDDISPPELARLAVESFIGDRKVIAPPRSPEGILSEHAGAFVTLRVSNGDLRGCIGTILAQASNVATEIIENAIGAACRDPRFSPVIPQELSDLVYGVDVLSAPETVSGIEDLDPARYGIILSSFKDSRRGVLLPGITGLDTAEQQWQAVHQKSGIAPGERVVVQRFTVRRFGKE